MFRFRFVLQSETEPESKFEIMILVRIFSHRIPTKWISGVVDTRARGIIFRESHLYIKVG